MRLVEGLYLWGVEVVVIELHSKGRLPPFVASLRGVEGLCKFGFCGPDREASRESDKLAISALEVDVLDPRVCPSGANFNDRGLV